MPAIQAYKGRCGEMIPVAEAKLSKVYRCPFTGTLYATKRNYVSHLKTLRKNRMHRRARQLARDRRLASLFEQPDFESIAEWFEINPDIVWETFKSGNSNNARWWDSVRDEFWMRITFLDLRYDDCVSNSHSCPRSGVQNWGRHEGLPKGYPGWSGRIKFELSHDIPGFFSDVFEYHFRIKTGTGGSGDGLRYNYDVKFFLDDWPGLERNRTMDILADRKPQRILYPGSGLRLGNKTVDNV